MHEVEQSVSNQANDYPPQRLFEAFPRIPSIPWFKMSLGEIFAFNNMTSGGHLRDARLPIPLI
jgi:hypothetical protein